MIIAYFSLKVFPDVLRMKKKIWEARLASIKGSD